MSGQKSGSRMLSSANGQSDGRSSSSSGVSLTTRSRPSAQAPVSRSGRCACRLGGAIGQQLCDAPTLFIDGGAPAFPVRIVGLVAPLQQMTDQNRQAVFQCPAFPFSQVLDLLDQIPGLGQVEQFNFVVIATMMGLIVAFSACQAVAGDLFGTIPWTPSLFMVTAVGFANVSGNTAIRSIPSIFQPESACTNRSPTPC